MFKKLFIHSLGRYITGLVLGIAIICINNAICKSWTLLMNYIDGFFIAGAVIVMFAGLCYITNLGVFDMFSYLFAKKGPEIKSLYDYKESKVEKRKKDTFGFMPYVVVGTLFLIITAILYIIFTSMN